MTEHTPRMGSRPAVACSLGQRELLQRRELVARDLFAFAEEIEEMADGYAWRFPGDGAWQDKLLAFIAAERRCCGFLRMELVFAPSLGPVWLTLRGPDGTKSFIQEAFVA